MNLAKTYSAELQGIEARLIEIEVDLNVGLHSFNIVGLADKALSEAKERVSSAIKNSGFKPPNKENRKITVNLAPADVKKTGSQYDLAIALGYLLASRQIESFDAVKRLFIGELALNGNVRRVDGALNFALLAQKMKLKEIYLPEENIEEVDFIDGPTIYPVTNLETLLSHLAAKTSIKPSVAKDFSPEANFDVAFSDIKGQQSAKRALMIAAAGGHNVLMSGPPGSGKTMLARAFVSILPPISLEESLETSRVWSAAGAMKGRYVAQRPFRSPHHTASPVAIVGGGPNPKPGEISLAHRGVLFLDELPEFRRDLLEALREPLESGEIFISRARDTLRFPARFILISAMNPCKCGYYNDPEKECQCAAYEVLRYQKKISGPLLDRIDIQIYVPRTKFETLKEKGGDDSEVKETVLSARRRQLKRFLDNGIDKLTNSELNSKECDRIISVAPEGETFVRSVFDKSFLSARGYYRMLKTAQTIADIEGGDSVEKRHLAEALGLRVRET